MGLCKCNIEFYAVVKMSTSCVKRSMMFNKHSSVRWKGSGTTLYLVEHLSTCTLPFTASYCPATDISVPLSEIYCTYHGGTDSARTAAGLLPLLVRPPGTVFRQGCVRVQNVQGQGQGQSYDFCPRNTPRSPRWCYI